MEQFTHKKLVRKGWHCQMSFYFPLINVFFFSRISTTSLRVWCKWAVALQGCVCLTFCLPVLYLLVQLSAVWSPLQRAGWCKLWWLLTTQSQQTRFTVRSLLFFSSNQVWRTCLFKTDTALIHIETTFSVTHYSVKTYSITRPAFKCYLKQLWGASSFVDSGTPYGNKW